MRSRLIRYTINDLLEVRDVFSKYGIVFWLDHGTLLGAIRDRRLIPWDTDVDLGMFEAEKRKLSRAINELRKKGFYVFYDNIIDRLIVMRFGLRINISFYKWIAKGRYVYERAWTTRSYIIIAGLDSIRRLMLIPQRAYLDYRLRLELLHHWSFLYRPFRLILVIPFKIRVAISSIMKFFIKLLAEILVKLIGGKSVAFVVPSHHFKELDTIEFYGANFYVPSDTEKYLERHYGKEWRVPKREWCWFKDDNSLRTIYEGKTIVRGNKVLTNST